MREIAFIGAGAMGEAMIAALLKRAAFPPDMIAAYDIADSRLMEVASRHGIDAQSNPASAARDARIIVLAVKPQDYAAACAPLAPVLHSGQTVVSIMAGVRLAQLREALQHDAIVRAMPNTPAQIGAGFVAWTGTPDLSEPERAGIQEVLSTLGDAVHVPDEKHIDMATAVSASGPGFVYLLVEAFTDAAVGIGLGRPLATRMVLQTIAGSVEYQRATGEHPATLRSRVTSPAGTTAAGLEAMEEHGVRAGIHAAVRAAFERAIELGE